MTHGSKFESFLADEVSKVKGIYYPVKAGFLRMAFIRTAACSKLHPNPNDEFCDPEIGPNYSIISRYEEAYRSVKDDLGALVFVDSAARERIEVEKIHPDGYMILNGHHRWAAAWRAGIKKLPIKIVDLTQETDVKKMLAASGSDRRVTLDLDETVFRPESDPYLEKPLRFPLNRIYRERLRLGIPGLFHMINRSGYDIWVYTEKYYSLEYLRYYFKHYHVPVKGIITGTGRKAPAGTDTRKELEKLAGIRYRLTVHIDKDAVIGTVTGSGSFKEFPLSGDDEAWPREVAEAFEKIKRKYPVASC